MTQAIENTIAYIEHIDPDAKARTDHYFADECMSFDEVMCEGNEDIDSDQIYPGLYDGDLIGGEMLVGRTIY